MFPLAVLLSMDNRVHWLLPCQVRALNVHGGWPKSPMVWRTLQLKTTTITLRLPLRPMAKMTTEQVAGEYTELGWVLLFLSSFIFPPSHFLPRRLSFARISEERQGLVPTRKALYPLSCTLSSAWVISSISQSLHYLLGALTYTYRAGPICSRISSKGTVRCLGMS